MLPIIEFSRRDMLRLLAAAGLAGFSPAAARASDFGDLSVLGAAQARQLLAVARTLFPHDFLDDDYYLAVVASLDASAATDSAESGILQRGLAKLPAGFVTMNEADREAFLRTLEDGEFFKLAYDATLNGLYGNADIARLLGDEGSSFEFGGYIDRGFDDIDWLPAE